MLFNSYVFIFAFLPLCLLLFWLTARCSRDMTVVVLSVASLLFYGWFDVALLPLIFGSVMANFILGRLLASQRERRPDQVRPLLWAAVAGNLALFGYFKYTNFLLETLRDGFGTGLAPLEIVLPLGISFFTFTQIAFLVDVAQGKAREYDFLRYLLFVSYFPHLIAGPILHHSEMMPQFARFGQGFRGNATAAALGLTLFAIGLGKKLGLADSIAPVADLVFETAHAGNRLSLAEAWTGAIAFTLQIYFDFSGYCDMASGVSLLFGVRLPANFNSPYQATSIIEFWRRWHMTLSRFLRDYVYIPLGGNRAGSARRYLNLMLTMLIGGLWHGAGWTFVLWGGVHGLFLTVNHLWCGTGLRLGRPLSWGLTFAAVVFAWVLFRAETLVQAMALIRPMMGVDGLSLMAKMSFPNELFNSRAQIWAQEVGLLAIALLLPNSLRWLARFRPVLDRWPVLSDLWLPIWRPGLTLGIVTGLILALGVALIGGESPFLYFQF